MTLIIGSGDKVLAEGAGDSIKTEYEDFLPAVSDEDRPDNQAKNRESDIYLAL